VTMLRSLPAMLALGLFSTTVQAQSAAANGAVEEIEARATIASDRDAARPAADREAMEEVGFAAGAARPAADREAMEDAMLGGGSSRFSSPFAYRHYLRARLAEASGDLRRALRELRQAAAYDFDSAELRLALGQIYARLGDLDQAELEMKRAIEALESAPDEELRASVESELRSLRMATLAPAVKVPVYEAIGVE